ncbi:uncharacterized protein LOC121728218 [Aricia agestis]|uniref:uncharacterized protein LOC121728218 n=1 Tax=Aricia agestis TaxID=91739 RepID=UPI001C20AFC4|nr:uncharacterized protein LOC121728218 [Aricia agestis]
MLVDRFRVELEKVDPSIEWRRAVLFMESSIDVSALYIQTDTPGMYRLIPTLAFQAESVPPNLIFALKLVEPGYLGIVNCQYRLCYALAPIDKLPDDDKLEAEAKKLGFYGHHNRSYLSQFHRPPLSPYLEDDSDDDEQVEIDNDMMMPNEL